jgi:pyridoxal phosphate enzyme (YggS family)
LSIKENIEQLTKEVSQNVQLIAVSKTRSVNEIMEAYDAGARHFGENKVQELTNKYEHIPKDVKWHLIGHLQRNKVKYLVGKVFLIHSLDSVRLLEEIEHLYSKANEQASVLIQINIGNEPTKTGIMIEELQNLILEVEKCNFVKVKGIMVTIPKGNEESCKKYFKMTKVIWDNIRKENYKNVHMEYLSMGMTNDYKYALEEGSNMIRIGEGIFGKRNYDL